MLPSFFLQTHKSLPSALRFLSTQAPPTAQQVKTLRLASNGAPLMECKAALTATFDKATGLYSQEDALKHLRSTGALKVTSKTGGRSANEGAVGTILFDGGKGVGGISLGCETDFAARGDTFTKLINTAVEEIIKGGVITPSSTYPYDLSTTLERIMGNLTVKTEWDDAMLIVRENMKLRSSVYVRNDQSKFYTYVHGKHASSTKDVSVGTLGSIVELQSIDDKLTEDELASVGNQLAMHIVATKPLYLSIAGVPTDVLDSEKSAILQETLTQDAKFSNKPADIQEKIIDGKLSKWFKKIVLLEGEHVVNEGGGVVKEVLKRRGVECKGFVLLE